MYIVPLSSVFDWKENKKATFVPRTKNVKLTVTTDRSLVMMLSPRAVPRKSSERSRTQSTQQHVGGIAQE